MGETGELVIGGVGLARYLDPSKDAEKFAPLPSLGWERAYRSGDLVARRARGPGVPRPRRRAGQARRAPDRAGRGRRRAAGAARRRRRRRRGRSAPRRATSCSSGYVVPPSDAASTTRRRGRAAARGAARRARAAARRRGRPADPDVGQGRPGRAALAAARRAPDGRGGRAARATEALARRAWTEVLGVAGRPSPDADFFATAAAAWPPPSWWRGSATRLPAGVGRRHLPAPDARRARAGAGRARRASTSRRAARSRRRRARAGLIAGAADAAAAGAGRAALGDRRWPRSATCSPIGRCPGRRPCPGGGSLAGWLLLFSPAGPDRASPPAARGCCCAACARATIRAAAACTCGCGPPSASPS